MSSRPAALVAAHALTRLRANLASDEAVRAAFGSGTHRLTPKLLAEGCVRAGVVLQSDELHALLALFAEGDLSIPAGVLADAIIAAPLPIAADKPEVPT